MIRLVAPKNIVMTPLIRVIIHHPNLMRSKVFLQAMKIFPQKLSGSYDARMRANQSEYQELLVQGMALIDTLPKTIIDIGTGTGIAAFAAAKVFPEAYILGIDHSDGMIAHAMEKLDQANTGRISFTQGNACDLLYDDQSFDLVVSSNAPIYLDEATRVLKFGGHLMVAFSFAFTAFTRVEADIMNMLKPYGVELLHLKGQGKGVVIIGKKHDASPAWETKTEDPCGG
ncbi:MAG: methyltransferase domain-containing protein [Sphaerochaeta sp.]|nr:methyltransferase domain-containing protein [Sphaerochaeta sp.]